MSDRSLNDQPTSEQPFIELTRVTKVFATASARVEAVADVSLSMNRGEFVALLGPSGCGKSTLLMMIAGLLEPTSGEVRIGSDVVRRPYTDVGIVFQSPVLLDWRTARQNVMFQAEMRHLSRARYDVRARELLKRVGLDGFEEKHPYELSGGMRQRVAICRALLHDPPILLMDEPFGALDALTSEQLRIDIEKLWIENHKTVVLVTHNIHEAVQLADRVVVMTPRPGRIDRVFDVALPRPRYERGVADPAFARLTEEIKAIFMAQGVLRT